MALQDGVTTAVVKKTGEEKPGSWSERTLEMYWRGKRCFDILLSIHIPTMDWLFVFQVYVSVQYV